MITAAEFGLAPGFCVTPDNLVALANYRSAAVIESAYIMVNTGERISADAVKAAITNTLQLDTEELAMYLFAGEMVIWERELSALDPEARRVALDEFEDNSHDVDIEQFRSAAQLAHLSDGARARMMTQGHWGGPEARVVLDPNENSFV